MHPRLAKSMFLATLAALAGCTESFYTGEHKISPPPTEYAIQTPYPAIETFAIAPAINLSGSRDFDVLVVSDLLYEELQQVSGLNVLPVNKTIIAMQRLGIRSIENPQDAQHLAQLLGADGLIIPAVTAYDPYNPPKVGMILQLYTPPGSALTPVPEETRPVVLANVDKPTIAADATPKSYKQPITQGRSRPQRHQPVRPPRAPGLCLRPHPIRFRPPGPQVPHGF